MTHDTEKFYDLHITGLGYLNRAREVRPARGDAFLAVEVCALHGAADAIQHTRFDCRVSGREAHRVVNELVPHVGAGRRVLVGFKLGDLYAETFTYRTGERAGETGVSLKARLLRIDWVRIDGDPVYRAQAAEPAA
ncbi:MAG: DUF3577 domain-containing protein [Chromatiales bacterium]|nr:DUF3577 domain-containing protein [Chromatiales bacterium]